MREGEKGREEEGLEIRVKNNKFRASFDQKCLLLSEHHKSAHFSISHTDAHDRPEATFLQITSRLACEHHKTVLHFFLWNELKTQLVQHIQLLPIPQDCGHFRPACIIGRGQAAVRCSRKLAG